MDTHTNLKYCLYARKSSESDERQAMSIDSQIKEMRDLAQREGIDIVDTKFESKSAKQSGQRDTYNELINDLETGKYNAILTWAPDRLSRNAGDLGSLVDRMDSGQLKQIRTVSQTFTNNPNEKFLLMILCSQAKLENDNRGLNVKRGIRAKCEMGWRPGVAPIGYMNRSFSGVKDIIPDPDRSETIVKIFEHAAEGWSGRKIKAWLDAQEFSNKSGKPVTLSQVFMILNNTFYYGEFEYPERSHIMYKGAHQPLISKELFSQVQNSRAVPNKAAWGSKTFAFKGIFKCATCGSDITAEEKFKQLKSGDFNRHVYYHCTRQIRYDCPEKYVNEEDLKSQLMHYIAENHELIEVSDELARKALRHTEVVEATLDIRGIEYEPLDPITEYSRYALMKGTYAEQGALVEGIMSKFVIRGQKLEITEKKNTIF